VFELEHKTDSISREVWVPFIKDEEFFLANKKEYQQLGITGSSSFSKGRFEGETTSMKSLFRQLEEKFEVVILLDENKLFETRFDWDMKIESFDDAQGQLEQMFGVFFKKERRKVLGKVLY